MGVARELPPRRPHARSLSLGDGLQLRRRARTGPPGASDAPPGGSLRPLDGASGMIDTRAIEAALFAAEAPMTAAELAEATGVGQAAAALAQLAQDYAGRGIELVERRGNWHF